jgi:hypothetical protein
MESNFTYFEIQVQAFGKLASLKPFSGDASQLDSEVTPRPESELN